MPLHSPSHIRSAWQQAGGDVKRATELLYDSSWDPKPPVLTPEARGRVKEIDEATKAERAAIKEKGKKSMIYANRVALAVESKPIQPSTPPPSTETVVDFTLSSPITPVVAPLRRKPLKKIVVDSDSEIELTDDNQAKSGIRQESTNESRALHYFNTAGVDALQELTGMFLCVW
jgi:SWI/SNF-related matrix-associated actin-dependent regulator 1 of chromatin subfamily A